MKADFAVDPFRESLLGYLDAMRARVVTEQGAWTVKGFIDVHQRIYTISLDTKVLSKVLEILLYPVLAQFAAENGFTIVPARVQNQYPDMSFVSAADPTICCAIDVKTTYRTRPGRDGQMRVSGMTLGTFGGYFRARDRALNSVFPYNRYLKHYVLGVVYSRVPEIDEYTVYEIDDLSKIPSVAQDFEFFLHEKYRIASDLPGSGNTRNIGSTHQLERLLNGTGVFAQLGIDIFDDYWMHYRTQAMAREEGFLRPPYRNLKEYQDYKRQGAAILNLPPEAIETEADDPDAIAFAGEISDLPE